MADKLKSDVIIIGGGIMGATMSVLLKILQPDWNIILLERFDKVAKESSAAWNNAGTGHQGNCELNYTPEIDGIIDTHKAEKVHSQFSQSLKFWQYLIDRYHLDPTFKHHVAHCSLVFGEENKDFLQKRFDAMKDLPGFDTMQFTTDTKVLQEWFPLIMNHRNPDQLLAATRVENGHDVNFELLTDELIRISESLGTEINVAHLVDDIDPVDNGEWVVFCKNLTTDEKLEYQAPFVFVGAGGGALKLLNKADIDEIDGYAGFPVGGKWLRCMNDEVIDQHHAKVYGMAELGAPPMSVPHLDTRYIDGKKELLFGPFAGFSTKFLKHGSYFDFFGSLDFDNIIPMVEAGIDNIPLTRYLIDQVLMSFDEKFAQLKKYYPSAKKEDWKVVEAGQRVQIIKKDEEGNGFIQFGTEIVHNHSGTIAGLLGASPGASTSVSAMLEVLHRCFPDHCSGNWKSTLDSIFE
ncbi:MAG: malate dehydrogenase (quinone) [Lewinellaceae bacterium]|nr:malate dehydrogenase (quinone) [Lewinellaceae bacterium]